MVQATTEQLDPITLEVISSSFVAICNEMGTAMIKTAYSPIFSEGRDFSIAMFDPSCEMVAQGVGCPAQLGALQFTMEWCVKDIGIDNLYPDDVLLHNDVYRGGTHLPEFTMIKPIFVDDELLALTSIIAHHVDVGGKSPGGFPGDATDVFMEGFRLPPVKLFNRGEPDLNVWRIYLSNTRTPRNSYGDMNAMYASILLGERRLLELLDRYGLGTVNAVMEAIKDYSERRMREEIRAIPDGLYEYEEYMDDDGVSEDGPYTIKVSVLVDGDTLVADYTGSSPQVKGPINCPFGVTASATYNAILELTDPTITTNGGCFRPIKIIAPARSITNVEYPGAQYGGNTETHNRVLDAVMGALAQAIPERVTGTEGGTCVNVTYGGIHPETGEQYANYQWEGVGWGARATKDGNSVFVPPVGNSRVQGVEVNETRFPWVVEEYSLAQDSGGTGRWRGGLGTVRIMRCAASEIEVNGLADRHLIAPCGRFGGGPGGTSAYLVQRKGSTEWKTFPEEFGSKSESKFANCVLYEGDRIMIVSPGGGGYGNPTERDRSLILDDLKQGYISSHTAIEVYGLTPEEAEGVSRVNSKSDHREGM